MKLRLTLLFAAIILLGFTAISKQRVKIINAEEIVFPILPTENDLDWIDNDTIVVDTIVSSNAISLILDTERDANGKALRRHIFVCQEGKELCFNYRLEPIIGTQKVSHLSFSANESGLAQWRKQLVRLFASKNEKLLTEIEKIKEKWSKGKITDEEYNSLVREAQMSQVQDLYSKRPIVIIKPMGNAESGDVIDALTVMKKCYISSFYIDDITHTDSVMVFNSLYPGKDMPSKVNFYTYGNIDYPQEFNFTLDVPKGYEDITNEFINTDADPMRFINNPLYSPVLAIEVTPSKKINDGASVSLRLYEDLFKNDLKSEYVEKNRKRRIKRLLASQSFRQLVKRFGDNVTTTKRFELGSNDASKSNDFQKSIRKIEETIIMGGKLEEYALWRNNRLLLIHTDTHTPYSALKCVTDNLRKINLNRMILAY